MEVRADRWPRAAVFDKAAGRQGRVPPLTPAPSPGSAGRLMPANGPRACLHSDAKRTINQLVVWLGIAEACSCTVNDAALGTWRPRRALERVRGRDAAGYGHSGHSPFGGDGQQADEGMVGRSE
jgi:hypothetical protein